MNVVKTSSFELSVYAQGDETAERLVIVLPGRLDTKDYAHIRSHVDYLATQGFYALSFDPPGTWGSPGDISLYTTTNILKAIDELIDYFGAKPTILIGHSRGGTNAMLAGTTNPNVTHFVAVMSHSGPTKVELPVNGKSVTSHRDIPPGTTRTKEQKNFDLPVSYFEDQEKYDAEEGLKQSTKPKLFFYGVKDVLISSESIKQIYNLAAEPKKLVELESEHDYRLHPEIIKQVEQEVDDFLKEYS